MNRKVKQKNLHCLVIIKKYKEVYELYKAGELDLLMLGQHFYENEDGSYSFHNEDKSEEYIGLCKAIVEGVNTGMFQVIAHTDRIFRRCRDGIRI